MHWILYAIGALAALVIFALVGRVKANITSERRGINEYAVKFYILGVRFLTLGLAFELENFIRPKLSLRFKKKIYSFYPLTGKGDNQIRSLHFDKFKLRAHIGLGDAFWDAVVCGVVNMTGGAVAAVYERPDWRITATPVFGKTYFWLEADCIISAQIADIIFALVGKNNKGDKGR